MYSCIVVIDATMCLLSKLGSRAASDETSRPRSHNHRVRGGGVRKRDFSDRIYIYIFYPYKTIKKRKTRVADDTVAEKRTTDD